MEQLIRLLNENARLSNAQLAVMLNKTEDEVADMILEAERHPRLSCADRSGEARYAAGDRADRASGHAEAGSRLRGCGGRGDAVRGSGKRIPDVGQL